MLDETKYPHFIPDKPQGEDVFEGKSQEHLAASICNYIKSIDVNPDNKDGINMPRIIGLEGGWGSGKSNVVRMIGDSLVKEGYYSFTYDAWGHQEDLQRRSILETLTKDLTSNDVLSGKVKIKTRTGDSFTETWEKQLQMLLSNKTIIKSHSVPTLSWAAIWAVLIAAVYGICLAVADKIIGDECPLCNNWWIYVIPIVLTIIIGLIYLVKDGSLKNAFKMVNKSEEDTTTFQYTSSEEPSITEFKNWMQAISDDLGKASDCSLKKKEFRKLIIVFDNMDRLPSDKVMQLWSCIYTFFASGEFENVWTIIPYDYKHLCQAITGKLNDEEDDQRIKRFINKTFPITYIVPQPVITDYEKLFYTYFDKAFGNKEHDRKHICQVFMHLEEHPNPRTVIRFVNELVAMRLQWKDEKYRLQNLALYILKKDYLFYSGESLDTQLLNEKLFDKIDPFYPSKEKVRTEMCQYAYGLEDEKLAGELPLRNELKRAVTAGESIASYVEKPNFLAVFNNVINYTDQATINNVVRSMASLDEAEIPEDVKEQLRIKWDFLANMKADAAYDGHVYDTTFTTLINHASKKRVIDMAMAYAKAMQKVTVKDGAAYFKAQHKMQESLKDAKVEFDDKGWYQPLLCEAERFVEYVCEAKDLYFRYGLTTDVKSLNGYLLDGAISGSSQVAIVVDYLKNDPNYDLSDLKKRLADAIKQDTIKDSITVAAYVNRVLAPGDEVLSVRFKKETVSSFLNEDQPPWKEKLPVGLEDVMAMSLADGNDLMGVDDSMIPRICGCMDRYMEYDHLLKNTGKDGSAFRKLNVYCVGHKVGNLFDVVYAARQLKELHSALGLDIAILLNHFNRWGTIDWGELNSDNQYITDVKNYVHQTFFNAYRDNPGDFSDSIIKLGVETLSQQNSGFLVKQQQVRQGYGSVTVLVIDAYWKGFVETYLGTKYMPEADELLTNEAVAMLQWLYDRNEVIDADLLNTILQYPNEATLRSYLHSMMNDHLSKTDINKEKFLCFGKLLPILGADMDDNTARGLITHFIKPICKDAECSTIIIGAKNFYLSVMHIDTAIAAPVLKEMVGQDGYASIVDELNQMLKVEEKNEV